MEHRLYNIENNQNGYREILQVYNKLTQFKDQSHTIRIERWFDANMCAVLGALVEDIPDVKFEISEDDIQNVFSRNGFVAHCDFPAQPDTWHTTIPYIRIPAQNYVTDLKSYLPMLTRSDGFPNITKALEKKIFENIAELFENANLHSHSSYIFSCGQYKPKTKVLYFTVVDRGMGFLQSVGSFDKSVRTHSEAIDWALKEGNSTKEHHSGGLGLTLLQNFIKKNGGRMTIISGNCFYMVEPEHSWKKLIYPFPGSVISLKFNSDDPATYCLPEEIPDNFPF